MAAQLGTMSEMACCNVARAALRGIAKNNDFTEAGMYTGAEAGIRSYYSTWGDAMIKTVTDSFVDALSAVGPDVAKILSKL